MCTEMSSWYVCRRGNAGMIRSCRSGQASLHVAKIRTTYDRIVLQ